MNKTEPEHYKSAIQPIDVIEQWGLCFCKGTALKYIARAGKKEGETEVDDLKKAVWYLQRRLKQLADRIEVPATEEDR